MQQKLLPLVLKHLNITSQDLTKVIGKKRLHSHHKQTDLSIERNETTLKKTIKTPLEDHKKATQTSYF